MTKEYVYFLIVLAASGSIITFIGARSINGRKQKMSARSLKEAKHSLDDSLLQLRRSASRLPRTSSNDVDFVKRVDVWQKEHQVRNAWFNTNRESITGTKYEYKPPPKRGSSAETSG